MSEADLTKLYATPSTQALKKPEKKLSPATGNWPYKPKAGEYFLKGPIPLTWLETAAKAGGKALHVGLDLWHLAQMNGSQSVRIEGKFLLGMGISRQSYYRALEKLERKGLVRCERKGSKRALITIVTRAKCQDVKAVAELAKQEPTNE